jgi:hypothetical protein
MVVYIYNIEGEKRKMTRICGHCKTKAIKEEEVLVLGGKVFCGYVCYEGMYGLEEGIWM